MGGAYADQFLPEARKSAKVLACIAVSRFARRKAIDGGESREGLPAHGFLGMMPKKGNVKFFFQARWWTRPRSPDARNERGGILRLLQHACTPHRKAFWIYAEKVSLASKRFSMHPPPVLKFVAKAVCHHRLRACPRVRWYRRRRVALAFNVASYARMAVENMIYMKVLASSKSYFKAEGKLVSILSRNTTREYEQSHSRSSQRFWLHRGEGNVTNSTDNLHAGITKRSQLVRCCFPICLYFHTYTQNVCRRKNMKWATFTCLSLSPSLCVWLKVISEKDVRSKNTWIFPVGF